MIYSVNIIDPVDWLQSKTTDEKKIALASSMHPTDAAGFAYELSAVNLHGKSFNFKPGLNVIVGPNGSGKSSIIRLLASIFCSIGEPSSTYSLDIISKSFASGIYSCCKVTANYDVSAFNLVRPQDVRISKIGESLVNGLNRLQTANKSDGQASMITVESLLRFFRNDGILVAGDKERNLLDLHLNLIGPFEEYHKSHNTEMTHIVSDYYKINHDPSCRAVTFLLDTPDDGLDIPNQRLLFKLFLQAINDPGKYQFIVSLNSLLLIQSLLPIEEIHWIDLDSGYLNAIADIGTFAVKKNTGKKGEDKNAVQEDVRTQGE